MNSIAQEVTVLNQTINCVDGLFSLNDLHKASGGDKKHQPANFMRLETTQDLIIEIEKENLNSSDVRNKKIAFKSIAGRFGGSYGCKELIYSYAMWISAKFHLTVIRVFDEYATGNQQTPQPKLEDLSTPKTRNPLKDAVNMMVPKIGLSYSDCYKMVHQRFGIKSVKELTNEQIPQAVEYVHTVLSGELMPRKAIEQPRLINDSRKSRVAAIAMMKAGSLAKARQDRIVEKLEGLLYEARKCINDIDDCNGMVHDGLSESRLHFAFNSDENKEAVKIAVERFERKFG